ncbi:hypothetical protein [Streptomyces sp. NPDC005890]|uniref:hypothetical protein n=1 Tax=Streptomyces sp. NPDC005890 TaxID=3154568 RepID=UPI0033D74C74
MRSRDYDLDFRDRASRIRAWGIGLLAVAGLLWTWCAVLLLTPYEAERKSDDPYPDQCEARLFTDRGTANEGLYKGDYCANERDWPEVLALLGLSVPVSLAGAVLVTTGTVHRTMSAHAEAMRELDGIADARGA